jgi:hypothetical protein
MKVEKVRAEGVLPQMEMEISADQTASQHAALSAQDKNDQKAENIGYDGQAARPLISLWETIIWQNLKDGTGMLFSYPSTE